LITLIINAHSRTFRLPDSFLGRRTAGRDMHGLDRVGTRSKRTVI